MSTQKNTVYIQSYRLEDLPEPQTFEDAVEQLVHWCQNRAHDSTIYAPHIDAKVMDAAKEAERLYYDATEVSAEAVQEFISLQPVIEKFLSQGEYHLENARQSMANFEGDERARQLFGHFNEEPQLERAVVEYPALLKVMNDLKTDLAIEPVNVRQEVPALQAQPVLALAC